VLRRDKAAKRGPTPAPFTPVFPCGVCGKYSERMRCSLEHNAEWARRKARDSNLAKSHRHGKAAECKECGRPFVMQYGDFKRVYCSDECAKERAVRINHYADRARRRGCAVIELVDPREVFEASNWHCEICGRKMLDLKSYPEPDSPSLDHIVPISRGGQHTRDNVRSAHFICNWLEYNGDWPSSVDRTIQGAAAGVGPSNPGAYPA
jgi:5-methylcytosine-specific restriction endonuclease McrA